MFSMNNILARAFYALNDIKTPMKISVVCLLLNLGFSLWLVQLYREQARYGERIYKWCDRTGLDHIRKAVVEDRAQRKALFARFAHSQLFAQSDPWTERAEKNVAAQEFTPMAELEVL